MEFYEGIGDHLTISQVALLTGLSDRTVRNYISLGLLQGEKINGIWRFTHEQVEAFVTHPSVRPSILSKKNAMVYDFLLDNKKKVGQSCIIMDLPDADRREIAEFFCGEINGGEFHNIRFSLDCPENSVPRVILSGDTSEVMDLAEKYRENSK